MLPLAEWINSLPVTESLREIAWFGAMINVMHLLALSVFAGALLIVDLRLMGGGLSKQPLSDVARNARPWLKWGFLGLVATGLPQLMLAPVKEYYSDLFWFKMEVMFVAIIFTFFIRPRLVELDESRLRIWGKLAGLASIALWSGVAIPARLIGLVS
jgi:uncharacterized protein DUF6644